MPSSSWIPSCSLLLAIAALTSFNDLGLVSAFSSIPAGFPPSSRKVSSGAATKTTTASQQKRLPLRGNSNEQSMTAASWRLVLDIGREPSGCRLPLVIPCEFQPDGCVQPHSDTVSFTGPQGAMERPVQGGTWELTNEKDLRLTLHFPESLQRREVTIDAGSTLQLQAQVYTRKELNQLNKEFYRARDAAWKIGGQLNELAKKQEAPKQWNEEKGVWEKRQFSKAHMLSYVHQRIQLLGAQAVQRQKASRRPSPKMLSSDRGPFPGVGSDIFMQKQGVVKFKGTLGDAVIGTWSAEPVNDLPVSYYNRN